MITRLLSDVLLPKDLLLLPVAQTSDARRCDGLATLARRERIPLADCSRGNAIPCRNDRELDSVAIEKRSAHFLQPLVMREHEVFEDRLLFRDEKQICASCSRAFPDLS